MKYFFERKHATPSHQQKVEQALQNLDKAIRRNPEDDSLLVQRAELLISLSQYPQAGSGKGNTTHSPASGHKIPAFPNEPPAVSTGPLLEALRCLRTAQAINSQSIANRMLASQDTNKDLLFLRAVSATLIQLRGPSLFQTVPEIDPIQMRVLLRREIPGLGERALQGVHTALSLYPLSPRIHLLRMMVLSLAFAAEESLLCCDLAIALSPEPAGLQHVKKLQELVRTSAPEPEFAYLSHALELTDLYLMKALLLNELKRPQEALHATEMASRLRPTSASAGAAGMPVIPPIPGGPVLQGNPLISLGRSMRETGHLEEALVALETACSLDPNSAEAHALRGRILKDLGRPQEALAAFEQALHLVPDDAGILYEKGRLMGALGRPQEALDAFEQALHLNPGDAEAYNGKGISLSHLGRHQEALVALEQAIHLNPHSVHAFYIKSFVLTQLGQLHEAWIAHQQATILDSNFVRHMDESLNGLENAGSG